MIPQELLASAPIAGQDSELRLYRHDRDFFFRIDGAELMSSRQVGSEEQLAELAIERLPDPSAVRVLVGGLGMGFTLAKLLELVGAEAKAEVVELVPEVVEWNRKWLGDLAGNPLDDPRVELIEGDVVKVIRSSRQPRYDAILLDVDNGPEGFVRDANSALYDGNGLRAAYVTLRPGGVLAIWASGVHSWFTKRIREHGFEVDEIRVRARREKGARRTIWVATRPA